MSCFCRLVLKWGLTFLENFVHSFFKYPLFGLIHFSEFKMKVQNLSTKGPVPFLWWKGEGWNTYPVWPKMQRCSEPLGNITASSTTRVHAANNSHFCKWPRASLHSGRFVYGRQHTSRLYSKLLWMRVRAFWFNALSLISCFYSIYRCWEELVTFGSQKRFIFNALLFARRNSASETTNTTFWESSFFLRLRITITGVTINITKLPNERQYSQVTRSDPHENSWSNADLRSAKKSRKQETTSPTSRRLPVRMRVGHGA